ncbi:hypothetical protein ABZ357_23900 [Streptomyces sp. NPDC005917]|uniref:hypothetical protein n=1 Tax=unclassified Streptomyces TaxID=2593676 RepID=UPI0033FC007A
MTGWLAPRSSSAWGSLGTPSTSLTALSAAVEGAAEAGDETEVIDRDEAAQE